MRRRKKSESSIPYTRSKNKTIAALWSGTNVADKSGSLIDPTPSENARKVTQFFCSYEVYSPLSTRGNSNGKFITPIRSSKGTRLRRILRILRASLLPCVKIKVNQSTMIKQFHCLVPKCCHWHVLFKSILSQWNKIHSQHRHKKVYHVVLTCKYNITIPHTIQVRMTISS